MSAAVTDWSAAVAIMHAGLASAKADPQALFQCTSAEQRRFIAELRYGEIYLHSGNKFGKTVIGARVGVALARGSRSLDGIELPALPSPNVGIVLSLDFKQQRLSVQPAYLAAVGDWPHKPEWNGQTLVSLRIKPEGCRSDNPKDWSLILFYSQENRRSGIGARGHWVHADEPPREEIWREVRKMGETNSVFVSFITATPLKRAQWYWLREDYPLEYEGRWCNGFLRLRAPAFNPDDPDDMSVGNAALTPADRRLLLQRYASDNDRVARITGLEMDTSGASPWKVNFEELRRWLAACTEPEETLDWRVSREVLTPQGKQVVTEVVEVEVWENYEPACVYRIFADTSKGIDDDEHDPGMAQVVNMTRGTQAARYRGFLGEYGLGVLAAGMSREWGGARCDPAVTGGYGEAFLTGYRAAGGTNLVSYTTYDAQGKARHHVGFTENAETNHLHAAAIREALVASEQGHPWFTIRCKEDVLELMDLVIDRKGRVDHEDGKHNESFTTLGRAASVLMPTGKGQRVPKPARSTRVAESPLVQLKRDLGLPVRRVNPRHVMRNGLKPRSAPR